MAKLKLTLACGNYDRTRGLLDGTIQPEGIDLNYLPLIPGETFWRMLNNEEFDASEMSLSTYTNLRSKGDERFIALPVFPSRIFRHSAIYINSASEIRKPEDLKGRRVAVGDYQMTAAVWVRGMLKHEYQVSPEEIHWIQGTPVRAGLDLPSNLHIEQIKPGESMEPKLEMGEIDALISVMIPRSIATDNGKVKRLFPNYREVEADYYRRTKIFPIMHTLVLKTELFQKEPWAAISLYKAFVKAKELNYRRLYDTDALTASLPWLIDEIENSRRIFGQDIWDYSIEGSRPTLDAMCQYLDEQGLTRRRMKVEEIFVPNIRPQLLHYLKATGED
ncbi:MAG: ABC transporter substrate-binding protein [Deltaproteobacteria bacterium]|nr:ABC transporter substrate-binding protein [Deltaproteobacteria bacterium]